MDEEECGMYDPTEDEELDLPPPGELSQTQKDSKYLSAVTLYTSRDHFL